MTKKLIRKSLHRRHFNRGALAAIGAGLLPARPASAQHSPGHPISVETIRRTRPHLLEPIDQHAAYLRRPLAERLRAGRVHVLAHPTVGTVSLARYQTAYRDQMDRGSCYAFASCAAMEAAYKRKYGVELHLSEQYAFHINKCFELYPNYASGTPVQAHENNTSFSGFQGSSDIIAKLAVCPVPDAVSVPYLSQAQLDAIRRSIPASGTLDGNGTQEQYDTFEYAPQHIPVAGRQHARYRVADYRALPASPTIEQVEAVLAAGHEVVADIPGHCTLLIGYDHGARQWLVKNSWNEGGPVHWGYDDPSHKILGAFYVTDVAPPTAEPAKHAWWIGHWQMDHDGWRGELVIRRTNDFHTSPDKPTKLGNYYRDGKRHDVNGQVIDGGQGIHFWIADGTNRVPPGSAQGQEFRAYVFSWDPVHAAGMTTWSGKPFGVRLGRAPLSGRGSRDFNAGAWNGVWAMNHDGWRGTLTLHGAPGAISGSYRTQQGQTLPVTAHIESGNPHVLDLMIPFAPNNHQQFRLACHTWENNIFSGTTVWANRTFGVMAERAGV